MDEKIKNVAAELPVQQQQEYEEHTQNELRIASGLEPINDPQFNTKMLFKKSDLVHISGGFFHI